MRIDAPIETRQDLRALAERLPNLFADCDPDQVGHIAVIYEPEWTIGAKEPATPDYVAASCAFIRRWIEQEYGGNVAEKTRIIYGGSVAPDYAPGLIASPDVDGLGAGRKGCDPIAFAQIVRLIAVSKGLA